MRYLILLGLMGSCTAMGCDERTEHPDATAGADAGSGRRDSGRSEVDASSAPDGGAPPERDGGAAPDAGRPSLRLPPANAAFDYQLGAAYGPPEGVLVVSRDRNARPASGLYNICYVNGFQTQPDAHSFWFDEHPELVLRNSRGEPVIDPDWDEALLDITTDPKRDALATIVGGWIDQCAEDGFDAIEIDNLDTYARSGGRIRQSDAVRYMSLLAARAHARAMPIAQKNAAEILDQRAQMGTDFAVVEECNRYAECDAFVDAYGDQVYVIEYRERDFNTGCRDFPALSIVLRDLELGGPSANGYVYQGC